MVEKNNVSPRRMWLPPSLSTCFVQPPSQPAITQPAPNQPSGNPPTHPCTHPPTHPPSQAASHPRTHPPIHPPRLPPPTRTPTLPLSHGYRFRFLVTGLYKTFSFLDGRRYSWARRWWTVGGAGETPSRHLFTTWIIRKVNIYVVQFMRHVW